MNKSDIEKEIEETQEKVRKTLERSRELDSLEGKILSVRRADGKAYYEVTQVKEDFVKIESRTDLSLDNWTLPIIGKSCWIQRENVENAVKRQEKMHEKFG